MLNRMKPQIIDPLFFCFSSTMISLQYWCATNKRSAILFSLEKQSAKSCPGKRNVLAFQLIFSVLLD